jgi:hypothetical protein
MIPQMAGMAWIITFSIFEVDLTIISVSPILTFDLLILTFFSPPVTSRPLKRTTITKQ